MFAAIETVANANPVWLTRRHKPNIATHATARVPIHAAPPQKFDKSKIYRESLGASMYHQLGCSRLLRARIRSCEPPRRHALLIMHTHENLRSCSTQSESKGAPKGPDIRVILISRNNTSRIPQGAVYVLLYTLLPISASYMTQAGLW